MMADGSQIGSNRARGAEQEMYKRRYVFAAQVFSTYGIVASGEINIATGVYGSTQSWIADVPEQKTFPLDLPFGPSTRRCCTCGTNSTGSFCRRFARCFHHAYSRGVHPHKIERDPFSIGSSRAKKRAMVWLI